MCHAAAAAFTTFISRRIDIDFINILCVKFYSRIENGFSAKELQRISLIEVIGIGLICIAHAKNAFWLALK